MKPKTKSFAKIDSERLQRMRSRRNLDARMRYHSRRYDEALELLNTAQRRYDSAKMEMLSLGLLGSVPQLAANRF